jgi:hypothetical protein
MYIYIYLYIYIHIYIYIFMHTYINECIGLKKENSQRISSKYLEPVNEEEEYIKINTVSHVPYVAPI